VEIANESEFKRLFAEFGAIHSKLPEMAMNCYADEVLLTELRM
jgi:hypothetical protein